MVSCPLPSILKNPPKYTSGGLANPNVFFCQNTPLDQPIRSALGVRKKLPYKIQIWQPGIHLPSWIPVSSTLPYHNFLLYEKVWWWYLSENIPSHTIAWAPNRPHRNSLQSHYAPYSSHAVDAAGHKPKTKRQVYTKPMVNSDECNLQIIVDSNLKNISLVNELEATVCCLQVIQCLPHITISSENDGLKSFRNIRNLQQKHNSIMHFFNAIEAKQIATKAVLSITIQMFPTSSHRQRQEPSKYCSMIKEPNMLGASYVRLPLKRIKCKNKDCICLHNLTSNIPLTKFSHYKVHAKVDNKLGNITILLDHIAVTQPRRPVT